MKVLFILHGWPPASIGGVEIYARRLAKEMSGKADVKAFCAESDEARPQYETRTVIDGDIEVTMVNYIPPPETDFESTYRNGKMAEVFGTYLDDAGSPDIAHVHHLGGLGHDIVAALHDRGVPIILTFHDFAFTCPRGQRLLDDMRICEHLSKNRCVECLKPQCKGPGIGTAGKVFRHIFKKSEGRRLIGEFWKSSEAVANRAAVITVPSEHHAKIVADDGFPKSKIKVMPYGYDIESFESVGRGEIGLAEKFGYIGSVIPSKGVHLILDAQKRLKKEYPDLDIEVHIHGPAPAYHGNSDYEATLKEKARGLNTTFHGPFDPENIADILAGLDAVIVPSVWWESHGMVVREANMAGLPVIVSNHGAVAEPVEDGKNGLLFLPGNARSLRDKIYILATTAGLADAISKNKMNVKSMKQDAADHIELYEEILNHFSSS